MARQLIVPIKVITKNIVDGKLDVGALTEVEEIRSKKFLNAVNELIAPHEVFGVNIELTVVSVVDGGEMVYFAFSI